MSRRVRDKLASNRGESLVEILVSVVITGLAMLMLSAVIARAYSVDQQTRARSEGLYEAISRAEARAPEETLGEGKLTVTFERAGEAYYPKVEWPVSFYGQEGLVYSYGERGTLP